MGFRSGAQQTECKTRSPAVAQGIECALETKSLPASDQPLSSMPPASRLRRRPRRPREAGSDVVDERLAPRRGRKGDRQGSILRPVRAPPCEHERAFTGQGQQSSRLRKNEASFSERPAEIPEVVRLGMADRREDVVDSCERVANAQHDVRDTTQVKKAPQLNYLTRRSRARDVVCEPDLGLFGQELSLTCARDFSRTFEVDAAIGGVNGACLSDSPVERSGEDDATDLH
jgi:hypothetical protein